VNYLLLFIFCLYFSFPGEEGRRKYDILKDLEIGQDTGDENYIFARITDIAVDSKFNIYVADGKEYRVQKYNEEGKFLKTIGRKGEGPGEFPGPPKLIEIDAQDNLYVYSRRKMIVFDVNGNYRKSFPIKLAINDFKFDRNNNLVILAYKNGKIFHIIDRNGEIISSFGEEFKLPERYNKYKHLRKLRIPYRFNILENNLYYISPFEYRVYIIKDEESKEIIKGKSKYYKPVTIKVIKGAYIIFFQQYSIFIINKLMMIYLTTEFPCGVVEFFENNRYIGSQKIDSILVEMDKKNRIYGFDNSDVPRMIRYRLKEK